jgi:type IV pilus assembly protein PilC
MERSVSRQKLSRFFRSTGMMLGSGITLLDSLEHLVMDESLLFAETVRDMNKRLTSGHSFSHALRQHPRIFPRVCGDLVQAGENSGTLHKSLDKLADYLDRSSHLEKRFVAAMVYPIIIVVLMLVMVLVMVWFVFPRERELLESLGAEMPLLTRVLFDWLGIIFHPAVVLVVGLAVFGGFTYYTGGQSGRPKDTLRRLIDTNILKIPLVGSLTFKFCSSRALSVFGTLLESGATVDQALDCAVKMMGNAELESRLRQAQMDLRNGYPFSESLENNHVFPTLAVQLFYVAEETGGLSVMSNRLAKIFEREVENAIETAADLVEPFALIFMGGFVGLILLATLLPTASIVSNL